MSFLRKHLGLDFVDLAIQVVLTGISMGFIGVVGSHGPATEGLMILVAGGSVLLFAHRRQRGLSRLAADPSVGLTTGQMAAARIEELESRVADLEATEARLVELEERLDFTERMLASGEREPLPLRGDRHG